MLILAMFVLQLVNGEPVISEAVCGQGPYSIVVNDESCCVKTKKESWVVRTCEPCPTERWSDWPECGGWKIDEQ